MNGDVLVVVLAVAIVSAAVAIVGHVSYRRARRAAGPSAAERLRIIQALEADVRRQAWNAQRDYAIRTAFHTGRPVFADSKGVLRFVDGDKEPVPPEGGGS